MERLTPLPWQASLWEQVRASRERLPHALLLHGARGIGKRHFARALAQSLLCESPEPQGHACGRCDGCLLLAADNHPDLRWLVPALDQPLRDETEEDGDDSAAQGAAKATKASRSILIDQVRAIGEFLALAAHRGGRRVVILAPAEALNGPAANALLKLLEEPPAGAVFVAVTDELDAVLPTVRSRCVLLRAPLPRAEVALAWLQAAGVDDAEAKLAEAGGAPVGLVLDGEDSRSLAPELRERLLGLLARGPRLGPADVASAVPKDVPIAAAIRLLQRWGWDLLAERAAGRVRYYPQQHRPIANVARACEPERLLEWLGRLGEAQATADHPLNARLVVESALIAYLDAVRPAR
jgi:DNA polymerase-3 subunit delta'